MLLDLPRVEYDSKDKVKKSDLDFVKDKNRNMNRDGKREGMTMAEMRDKK